MKFTICSTECNQNLSEFFFSILIMSILQIVSNDQLFFLCICLRNISGLYVNTSRNLPTIYLPNVDSACSPFPAPLTLLWS